MASIFLGIKKIVIGSMGAICVIVPAKSYSQENFNTQSVAQYSSQYKNDIHFDKVEEFFVKEQYSQALVEIGKAKEHKLGLYQNSILPFYEAICSSYMLQNEVKPIITSFLETSNNKIYNNIAKSILAEDYLMKGDYKNAGKTFKEVDVAALSKSMMVRYNFYYGKYFFDTKQYLEARYRLSQASKSKSIYSNDILYFLSYIKYTEKDYDGAMEGFAKLSSKSKFAKANIYMAQIKFHNKDYQFIIDNSEQLIKISSEDKNKEVYRLIGESYYNVNDYSNSLKYLDIYEKNGGVLAREQHYIMGYCNYMNNYYDKAISHFTQILSGEDNMVQNAYYHLADSYLKVGDLLGALRAFSMAATMNYNTDISEDALYNQVKLSYQTGGGDVYTQLIELMRRFIVKYPQSDKINEIRGYLLSVYINTQDYDNAIAAIEKVKNPSNSIIGALQRMCYEQATNKFNQRNYNESVKLFDKTITYNISPKYTALAYFWKAEAMSKADYNMVDVIDTFKKYISLSTTRVRENKFAHYNIAYQYFNNKRWSEAEQWFKKFLNIYNDNKIYVSDTYSRLGDIAFGHRAYSDAIANYTKAKDISSENGDYPAYQVAVCYGLMGKTNDKISKLKEISASNSSIYDDLVELELASTYNKANRYSEAEKVLKTFVANKSNSPYYVSALLESGVATLNQNKNKEALSFYKRIVKEYPNSIESKDALLAIKSIYVSQGDVTPYFEFMKDSGMVGEIDASQKEQLSFEALQNQYIAGNYKALISQSRKYRSSFSKGLHSNDVDFYLAEALYRTKDYSQSIKELERIISMPSNQYTLSALAFADKIYTTNKNTRKAYDCNAKIFELSSDNSQRKTALEKMMRLAIQTNNNDVIRISADKVLSEKIASKEAIQFAQFAKGRLAFEVKDYVTAFAMLRKSALSLSTSEGAESEYMKAVILFSEKKYADTETFIITFSKRGTPHQYWLAKSFLLLGDVYVARGDLFQAKATYQSIIEGYKVSNDGIIKEAKEKIAKIGAESTTK